MLSRIFTAALLVSCTTPAFAQQTHTGRIEPNKINMYSLNPGAPGQLLATLSWDSAAAHLVLILVCNVEGEEIGYGVASGLLERTARLESGLLPSPCELGVITADAAANYALNLQFSQPIGATPQAPAALPVRTSVRQALIPGTSSGTALEKIAFRLQFALDRLANPR